MTNKEKAESVFREELDLISDEKLREETANAFDLASPDFFLWPASSSGRFHPDISNGRHGLVNHTKLVVLCAVELCRAFDVPSNHIHDCIVSACILHDITKFDLHSGPSGRGYSGHYKKHGYLAYRLLSTTTSLPVDVTKAVGGHMGVWACEEAQPFTFLNTGDRISEIVMLADYVASRKFSRFYDRIKMMDVGSRLEALNGK